MNSQNHHAAFKLSGWLAHACVCLLIIGAAQDVGAQAPNEEVLQQRALQEELLRQQREQAENHRLQTKPDVRLSAPPTDLRGDARLPDGEQPCFNIARIELTGEDAARFQWAMDAAGRAPSGSNDSPIGRCLGAEGVKVVMARLQNAIMAKGHVTTRVLAPPQHLSSGTLTLSVLPGRVRAIRFAQAAPPERATWWNALPVRPGDILNLRDIEQGLENFKRLSSVNVDIQIAASDAPDARPGESDLVINWQQSLPLRFAFSLDDAGSRATGRYQGNATLMYDHALTLHDQLVLSVQQDLGGGQAGARGSSGQSVQYTVPFGYWMVGASGASSRYHQTVQGQVTDFQYRGISQAGDIRVGRVVYRDGVHKVSASLKGWSRSSRNHLNDVEQVLQRKQTGGWEIGLQHRAVWSGTALDLSLNHRRGTGAFNAQPASDTTRMKVWTADAQINRAFMLAGQRLRHHSVLRAQWNQTSLASQDRFGIGSRYTVRGFDGETQLTGERGWLLRQDLAWTPGSLPQEVYAGIDHGRVTGARFPVTTDASLTGAALGYRGMLSQLGFDVFVSWPLQAPRELKKSSSVAGFSVHGSF